MSKEQMIKVRTEYREIYCRVCGEVMQEINTVWTTWFKCENPKCNAYLRNTSPYNNTPTGKVWIEKKMLIKPKI